MQLNEVVRASTPLPRQLNAIRTAAGRTIVDLAAQTRLSRLTVAAAEGQTDARLSTLVALFDELGFALLPVPKTMAAEVVRFINHGGRSVSLPAGTSAPLGIGQRSFSESAPNAEADQIE